MWTKEQFQAWKARPETQAFLMFLNEVREELKEKWAKGVPLSDKEHAIAMAYGDILDLKWSSDDPTDPTVAAFYEIEDEENDEPEQ